MSEQHNGGGTRRVLPHDQTGKTEQRRENEKVLVQNLLDGNLGHAGDEAAGMDEYVRKAKEMHEDASVDDLATLALARKPKVKESHYHSPELSTMDIERSKQLVSDAVLLAQEAQKRKPAAKKTSEAERAKIDESFYFRYEKLHDAQEDVELARKELGVNMREGNFLDIQDILKDGVDPAMKEVDEAKLGSLETFKKVQEVIAGLYVRKPHVGEVEADSPAYLQMIKRKLHESRVQVDELRSKIKELSAGLRVASLECKSGQQILADRNEELMRQRKVVTMLQLHNRNQKHRNGNTGVFGAGGGAGGTTKTEELMRDYEELRQENEDLVDINLVLEKEVKVLQVKSQFRGMGGSVIGAENPLSPNAAGSIHGGTGGGGSQASAGTVGGKTSSTFLQAVESAQVQKTASERKRETPTTQALKKLKAGRRAWSNRLIVSEKCMMALHDFDGHSNKSHNTKLLLQPAIRSRNRGGADANSEDGAESERSAPRGGPLGDQRGYGGGGGGLTSRTGSSLRGKSEPGDVRSERSSRTGSPDGLSAGGYHSGASLTRGPSPRGSPRANMRTRSADGHRGGDESGNGWEQSSKAWTAMRRKILGTVALSRADVMRREESHVRKMRSRVTLLVSELSVANAEREMLLEKCNRFELENTAVKGQLARSQERVEKMMVLTGLSGGGGDGGAGLSGLAGTGRHHRSMEESTSFGAVDDAQLEAMIGRGSGAVWKTPADDGEATDELIAEEFTRLRTLKGKHKKDNRELSTAMEKQAEIEDQMKAVTDILNGKIGRLETECNDKDNKINDLMRMVSQRETDGDSHNPRDATAMAASVMQGPDTESIRVKALEKEVFKKDQFVANTEVENRKLKVRLNVAEDKLTEERATTNLGLSRKTAIRAVAVLRRLLSRARERIEQRRLELERDYDDDAEGILSVTDVGGVAGTVHGKMSIRAPKSEDPLLKSKRVLFEEAEDEEESVLRQVFHLAMNPQQKDIVSKQISALELTESQVVLGGPVARREKEWFRARRLWLRLLTIREQAWQEAITEDYRRRMETRVTDTYEAFVKFEQSDVSDSRPSMASNGVLRVLSMAASPIADKTGLKSLDEVEREYKALAELVKTRNTQLLKLQSERDEAVAEIDKLSVGHGKHTGKKVAVPPSALSISHVIKQGETAASIAALYGLTNHSLINELFEHAPRASFAPDPQYIWVPLRTEAALDTVVATEEEPILVVRHIVQDNETLGSIAAKFEVSVDQLRQVASEKPVDLSKAGGVPCVDIWVKQKVALAHVMQFSPDTPTQQLENCVFAALPFDGIFGKVSLRALGRIFNTTEFDLSLYNDALEPDQVTHVPLLLHKATMAQIPALVGDMKVHVWHTVRENDTKESIADRYSVMESRLDGQNLTVRSQIQVPLTSLPALASVIQDPALISAVEAVNQAEEAEEEAAIAAAAAGGDAALSLLAPPRVLADGGTNDDEGSSGDVVGTTSSSNNAAANIPLLSMDRGTNIRAQLKRLESRAGSVVSRKNTMSLRSTSDANSPKRGDDSGASPTFTAGTSTPDIGRSARRAHIASSASVCVLGDEEENYSSMVVNSDKLLSVARRQHTLREEIQVPNFTLLNGSGTLWLARLRTADSLRRAREEGAEVHCLINLVDETIESLANDLSIAAILIIQHNEELEISDLQEKRFDHVRIPLINLKVQQHCLRRSGMVYAVVPTYGKDLDTIAADYAVAHNDLSAYHVELEPQTTPKIFFNRFPRAYDAAEHRMTFNLPIDGLDYSALTVDQQQQLLMAIEMDTLGVVEFAATLGVDGNVLGTSVTDIIRPNRFAVQVFCDTYAMASAVRKTMVEDGMYTPMEHTQRFLHTEKLLPEDASGVTLSNNTHHLYQFNLKALESTVIGVDTTKSLTDIAMYCGIGVEALYAFNNSLSLTMELPNAMDNAPQSVLGVHELVIPGTNDTTHIVSSTDTLQSIALRHNVSMLELRRVNIRCLPLAPLVRSVRVPVLPHISRPSMIIKAQAEESFLALCTRFGVEVDSVRADSVTISHGTQLEMPALSGYTTKLNRSRLPNVHPKLRTAERGETAVSIAEETGLLQGEVIVANPSRVRILVGASVHVPVMSNRSKVLTARPTTPQHGSSSSTATTPASNSGTTKVGQTKREGLFIRHKITGDETLSKVASTFFQPVTALMNANSSLFHVPGVHLILVPLPQDERDEILVAQVPNVVTIVMPGPHDKSNPLSSLSRKFGVDFDKVKEINTFMNDPKHFVMPLISGLAVSLARQQNLQLYAAVQLQQGETLVSLADRYGVFVKDLIVLGKSLARLGVTTIDVPVAFDVAKRMQANPVHEDDRIMLASELHPGEQLKTFLGELGAGASEVKCHDTASTYTEVVLSTVKGLEKARDRETDRLSQRSKLIDRTMAIGQALRQLSERNEATHRELEKVSTIRDSNKELAIHRQMAMNLESIGVQTEEAKVEARGKMNQRNGMAQTKLSGQQYDYLEQTIVQHVEDIAGLTTQRNTLDQKVAELSKKTQAQSKRIVEIGIQLTERTDRLNHYMQSRGSPTGSTPALNPTPPSVDGEDGGSSSNHISRKTSASAAAGASAGTPNDSDRPGSASTHTTMNEADTAAGGASRQPSRPSTCDALRPRRSTTTTVGPTGTVTTIDSRYYSSQGVQCSLIVAGSSGTRSPGLTPPGGAYRTSASGGDSSTVLTPTDKSSAPLPHLLHSEPNTSTDVKPSRKSGGGHGSEKSMSKSHNRANRSGGSGGNPLSDSEGSTSAGTSIRSERVRKSASFRGPSGSISSTRSRGSTSGPTSGTKTTSGGRNSLAQSARGGRPTEDSTNPSPPPSQYDVTKLKRLTIEHRKLKMSVKNAAIGFQNHARQLANDVQVLREEFLGLFGMLSADLATELLPLTTWKSADFGVNMMRKAQSDEAKRNEARVLEGVRLVSRNLVPYLNESFSKARVRRLESTVLTDEMKHLLESVGVAGRKRNSSSASTAGSADDEAAWVTSQLGKYVNAQVAQAAAHSAASGENPPNFDRWSMPNTVDTSCDPMTPRGTTTSNIISTARRQVGSADPALTRGSSRRISEQPLAMNQSPGIGDYISLPAIRQAHTHVPPERSPALTALLGLGGHAPVGGHIVPVKLSSRGGASGTSTSNSPIPGVVGDGLGGGKFPAPPHHSGGGGAFSHLDPHQEESLSALLGSNRTKSEIDRRLRSFARKFDPNAKNSRSGGGNGVDAFAGIGTRIDDEYDRIQGGVADLVAGELEKEHQDPHPQVRPDVRQQVQEEVVPVLGVISQLAEQQKIMGPEQRKEVDEIRQVDESLRKQQARAHFAAMGGKIKVRALLNRVRQFEGAGEFAPEDFLKVQGLWKTWLYRWAGVQKKLRQKRRENMQRLLNVFIEDEQHPAGTGRGGARGSVGGAGTGRDFSSLANGRQMVGRVPTGYTTTAGYGSPNNGIIVLRPFRPGTTLRPLMSPVRRTAPVPEKEKSSAHFSAVNFDQQD